MSCKVPTWSSGRAPPQGQREGEPGGGGTGGEVGGERGAGRAHRPATSTVQRIASRPAAWSSDALTMVHRVSS